MWYKREPGDSETGGSPQTNIFIFPLRRDTNCYLNVWTAAFASKHTNNGGNTIIKKNKRDVFFSLQTASIYEWSSRRFALYSFSELYKKENRKESKQNQK